MNRLEKREFLSDSLCLCVSLPLIVSVYSVYSVVSYPLKFSTADGSKKWEFLEAENRTVFYGLGAEGAEVEISIEYWVFLLACHNENCWLLPASAGRWEVSGAYWDYVRCH